MKAIVGLGNPGPRYRHTRHNVGWAVLDELAARWGAAKAMPEKRHHAAVVRASFGGEQVLLVKPQTFMNDSGKTVRSLVEKERLSPVDLLVIYDDIDLGAGRIRVRASGSSGGHNGMKSIQQHLSQVLKHRAASGHERVDGALPDGSSTPTSATGAGAKADQPTATGPPAFARIKIGLGRPPAGVDPIDYVLTTFTPDELAIVKAAIERAADAAECWLDEGIEVAMNRYNGAAVS
jgi:PTH1 family peptidyl-tRNA hydrolase